MTDQEIAMAKARAEDICNGFMAVRMTQARDVVLLANELQAMRRKLDCEQAENEAPLGPLFEAIFRGKS